MPKLKIAKAMWKSLSAGLIKTFQCYKTDPDSSVS